MAFQYFLGVFDDVQRRAVYIKFEESDLADLESGGLEMEIENLIEELKGKKKYRRGDAE